MTRRVTVIAVLMMLVALLVVTLAAFAQPEPAPPPAAQTQPVPAQPPTETAPPAAAPAPPAPAAPTPPAQAESILLRLKFSPGEIMRYRIFADAQGVVRMNMPMPAQSPPMPPELPVRVVIQGVGTAKVLRVDSANAARLRVGGDNLTMTMQVMGQSFTMTLKGGKYTVTQNGKPVEGGKMPMMPKGMKIPFIQEPIELKIGPRGEVLDIAIPSMGALAAMMPGVTMKEMLKDQILLPEQPLVVGQTWSADRTQNLPGTTAPVTYGLRMALEKVETWEGKRKVGALRIESVTTARDIDLSKFAGPQMSQGQPMPPVTGTMNMQQQVGGNMLFDATRGVMMRFDFQASQEMSMQSSVTLPQKGTQNMSMNMQFTVKGAVAKI